MSKVDAQAASAAAAAVVVVDTSQGGELTLDPGRQVVARVVGVGDNGAARISLAGQLVDVTTTAQLRVGDEVQLAVTRADATGVRLALVTPDAATGQGSIGTPPQGSAASLIGELARAGVPVTAQIAQAVSTIAEQIGGGSTAARAVASLAARDLALSPAAAGRVASALDLAGTLGPSLTSLASRSSAVAAALPSGVPSSEALRSLLAPALSSTEVAVARIVQAAQATGPGGPATPPSAPASSAAVIQNYVASQVAASASLDDLAAQSSVLGRASVAGTPTTPPVAVPTSGSGLANAALQGALRGLGAVPLAPGAAPSAAPPLTLAAPVALAPGAGAGAAPAPAAAASAARAGATAAAATGAAAAMPTPTSLPAAGAIADLASLAVRFVPAVAAAAGGPGSTAGTAARGATTMDVAQQAGAAGSVGAQTASVAGAGASGDPAPLVAALQTYLASGRTEGDSQRLLRTLAGADPQALQTAIRTLPESQSLQLAGRLLDLLPAGTALPGAAAHELRLGVHTALDQLGRSLVPPGGDDVAALRSALEHVAANDPRPAVAADASRLLAVADGQQILSRATTGADPGYVYFQVPLPDGRGAEVMVRREPGRREVSFDEFNIAFLLSTEHIGTLMIQLDAHPAGIRADVKTDNPALEPYLRARTEALIEPLGRESRRPVTVTTGVFDKEPPQSLLSPQLGQLEPGANEFYA